MSMPPGVVRFTEPFLDTFLPVPPIHPGVCRLCHGTADPSDALCWSCRRTTEQVTRPVDEVVPISLCEAHGQLHYLLRKYKDGPSELRRRLRPRVAGLVGRFLAEHEQCLGPWDIVTTVPSGRSRQGTHPLVTALHMLPLRTRQRRLLRADPAAPHGAHLAASDDRFTLTEEVANARVLLVDDTFTSGAALQSAASRLQIAGAHVTAVVLGRYVKPEYSASLLTRSRAASRSGSTAAVAAMMTGESDKGRPTRTYLIRYGTSIGSRKLASAAKGEAGRSWELSWSGSFMPGSIATVGCSVWDPHPRHAGGAKMARPATADQLAGYQRRYRELASQLAGIGLIASGSITRRYTRCGSPGCRCHAEPPATPRPVLPVDRTTKVNGKTVTRRLTEHQASLYQEWIGNDRKLRALIGQMRKVATKAAELLLEEATNTSGKV